MLAVVTGASRGIGRSLSLKLCADGWDVVGIARSRENLEKIGSDCDKFRYVLGDLSSSDEVSRIAKEIGGFANRIDLLVNNAGAGLYKGVLQHNVKEVYELAGLNFAAPLALTNALVELMPANSTVVFVVTSAIHVAFSPLPIYGAAKLGLHYAVKVLRRELKERGIRVLAVYPGYVRTDFHERGGGMLSDGGISPDYVAEKIIESIKKGKEELYMPSYLKLLKIIGPYLPIVSIGKS